MNAYYDLLTCRTPDGQVPWRDMIAYADYHELEEDVAKSFVRIMRSVDSERLERQHAKREQSRSDRPQAGTGEHESIRRSVSRPREK